jgi:hypothetical protein
MPMTVILLTQEANSRGDQIAVGLSARLGFELVRQEQIEQRVAERMHVSVPTVRRLLEGNASLIETWLIGSNRVVRFAAEEVIKLAARGSIVVQSWTATNYLRLIGHVVCVRVCAARPQLPALTGTSVTVVQHPPLSRGRAGLRCWPFAANRDDSEYYDLVLNTALMPVDECVEQVRRLAQGSQFQPTSASRAMLASFAMEAFEVSLSILGSSATRFAPVLEVDVDGDTIRLSTPVSNEEAIARVEQHLRGRKDCPSFATHGVSTAIHHETI